jgi:hypothetical protein
MSTDFSFNNLVVTSSAAALDRQRMEHPAGLWLTAQRPLNTTPV